MGDHDSSSDSEEDSYDFAEDDEGFHDLIKDDGTDYDRHRDEYAYLKYYHPGVTRRVKPGPRHDPEVQKQLCKKEASSGLRAPINFYITAVETLNATKMYPFDKLYAREDQPDYIEHGAVTNIGTVTELSQYSNAQSSRYKDLIFFRGRKCPNGNQVFGVVDYSDYNEIDNVMTFGPRFYVEAREGFDGFSYSNSFDKDDILPSEAKEYKSTDSVDKFIRWVQNYMFVKQKNKQPDIYTPIDPKQRSYITNPNSIISYCTRFNEEGYKTFYGYVPDKENHGPDRYVLEIRVTSKIASTKLASFFASDEYLNLVKEKVVPTIRCFEGSLTFDSHWRFQNDIVFGHCYNTTNYKIMSDQMIESTFQKKLQNAFYIIIKPNSIQKLPDGSREKGKLIPKTLAGCIEEPFNKCKMVKVGFDIEARNSKVPFVGSCFPVAKFTGQAYADRYKMFLENDNYYKVVNAVNPKKTLIEILLTDEKCVNFFGQLEIGPNKERCFARAKPFPYKKSLLEKYIPSDEASDPITAIATVTRKLEDGEQLYSDIGCSVATWNGSITQGAALKKTLKLPTPSKIAGSSTKVQAVIDANADPVKKFDVSATTKKELNIDNITLGSDYFKNCKLIDMKDELSMIKIVTKYWQELCPDYIVGHNILNFDLPYILDRMETLKKLNPTDATGDPFTFSIFKGHVGVYYVTSFQRNTAVKTSWSISAPGMNFFDTCYGLKHETFGQRLETYKLSFAMNKWLTYPENSKPMKKLEIDIIRSSELWYKRGDGLAYFLGYCLYDALGSIMIAEKLKMIDFAVMVAETVGAHPASIYQKGVQNIVLTCFHQTIWGYGKNFLYPDYDVRQMHFPDLWYWHYEDRDKDGNFIYTDVRKLFETIPCLNRKWKMGGLRPIPDLRNNPNQHIINPYLPKQTSKEYVYCSYSKKEIAEKQKQESIKVVNPITKKTETIKKPSIFPKAKPYEGALVAEVIRQFILECYIPTFDKTSMYPTLAETHGLDFPNFVTEFTKKHFKIPRYELVQIVLGSSGLIQFGDVITDRNKARFALVSDSDEVVATYYRQDLSPKNSIVGNMVRTLLSSRKDTKNKGADWAKLCGRLKINIKMMQQFKEHKNYSQVLNYITKIKNTPAGNKDLDSADKYDNVPYFEGMISIFEKHLPKNGENEIEAFLKAVDEVIYQQNLNLKDYRTMAVTDFEFIPKINKDNSSPMDLLIKQSSILGPCQKKTALEVDIADKGQNSKKLVMNSTYGGVSMSDGQMPQVQLGSAITALGRITIARAANIMQNTDYINEVIKINEMQKKKDPKCVGIKDIVEKNIGKSLEDLRKTLPLGTLCGMVNTNGDTDSTIGAYPTSIFPYPHSLDILRKLIGPHMAAEVNKYLPQVLKPKFLKSNWIKELSAIRSQIESKFPIELTDFLNLGLMSNENEKIGFMSLINKKKNYIQQVVMPNGKIEENFKGVASKKSDTLPFVAKLEKELCAEYIFKPFKTDETHRDRVMSVINHIQKSIVHLLRGNYNPEDFKMCKRLKRPINMYKNPDREEHVRIAKKREARGCPVGIGDAVYYVYILTKENDPLASSNDSNTDSGKIFTTKTIDSFIKKKANVDVASLEQLDSSIKRVIENVGDAGLKRGRNIEDAEYALKNGLTLDINYYLEKKILPKLCIFLAPMLFSHKDYPMAPLLCTTKTKKRVKKLKDTTETYQENIAYDMIMSGNVKEEVDKIFEYRFQRQFIEAKLEKGEHVLPPLRIHRCAYCFDFYKDSSPLGDDPVLYHHFIHESKDNPGFYGICAECKKKSVRSVLVQNYTKQIQKKSEELQESTNSCWECIQNTCVSMKSSLVEQYKKDNKEVKNMKKEDLYWTQPDDCTMRDCSVYKAKKNSEYEKIKLENRLCVLKQLPDW
jgi:DNA polymerase elongation subunit (family B)